MSQVWGRGCQPHCAQLIPAPRGAQAGQGGQGQAGAQRGQLVRGGAQEAGGGAQQGAVGGLGGGVDQPARFLSAELQGLHLIQQLLQRQLGVLGDGGGGGWGSGISRDWLGGGLHAWRARQSVSAGPRQVMRQAVHTGLPSLLAATTPHLDSCVDASVAAHQPRGAEAH